eukprot:sb/3470918/
MATNSLGTLTETQFVAQCRSIVEVATKIGDSWEMRQGDWGDVYLVKKVTKATPLPSNKDDNDDGDDDNVVVTPSSMVTWEYHVTYRSSYSVPVLFFKAWHPTGQLLTLDEVWELTPPAPETAPYITQMEHPVLAVPFYEVHPCTTERLMAAKPDIDLPDLTKSKHDLTDRYLVSWMSIMGQTFGLDLDIRYALM